MCLNGLGILKMKNCCSLVDIVTCLNCPFLTFFFLGVCMWYMPVCIHVCGVYRCLCRCVEAGRGCKVSPSIAFCLILETRALSHWTWIFTVFLQKTVFQSSSNFLVSWAPSNQCWTYNLHSHACLYLWVWESKLWSSCVYSKCSDLLSRFLPNPLTVILAFVKRE